MARRIYQSPNYRTKHKNGFHFDDEGRVTDLFGKEISAVIVESRYHFFKEEARDKWELVRAYYGLPAKKKPTLKTHGVRRSEGKLVGIGRYPARPIHVIQEERGVEAGVETYRTPNLDKMIARDLRSEKKAEREEDARQLALDPDYLEKKRKRQEEQDAAVRESIRKMEEEDKCPLAAALQGDGDHEIPF